MTRAHPPTFQPQDIIAALARHGVDYVLIGGFAAVAHGAPHITNDLDITPNDDLNNLERLSAALEDLDAHVRADHEGGETFEFRHDASSLKNQAILHLTTRAGNLDVTFVPSGTRGYRDLRRDAVEISVDSVPVVVASLADVIRSKEAANRPKDRAALPVLRRLLEEQSEDRRRRRKGGSRG